MVLPWVSVQVKPLVELVAIRIKHARSRAIILKIPINETGVFDVEGIAVHARIGEP